MSKYDFEIDLSENTSTGMILSKIEEGSVVLEFGCATGRMTRYMKEQLGCRVYIVEYDEQAFRVAREYAEDGLCDDIMSFRWVEKFREIAFDAIVFADVLEHLSGPEQVLAKAAELLKPTGSIHVSLPNITHNDILLKAHAERFDYTSTGLLDDTHVHFWGMRNLAALAENTGLTLRSVGGTYCPACGTEQQVEPGGQPLLENILRERQCGEIYQFVMTLDKIPGGETCCSFPVSAITGHIYLDLGDDFQPENVVPVRCVYSGKGSYLLRYQQDNPGNIKRIKFDPVEMQGCILRQISIRQGERELPLIVPAGIALEDGLYLPGDDPMVYANVPDADTALTVEAEILLPGAGYLQILQRACEEKHAQLESLMGENDSFAREKRELQNTVDELTAEAEKTGARMAELEQKNREQNRDVCAYIMLANNKDQHILEQKQQLREQKQQIQKLEQQLRETEAVRDELRRRYNRTISGFLRRAARFVIRRCRALRQRIR